MSNILISFVVVTAGRKDYLWALLDSIKDQDCSAQEILVVSNSPDQNFNLEIVNRYPDIKVYLNSRNLFYCQALNTGIKASKGDFILCLNDDVVLEKGFIREAIKGFLADSKVGMVSGKILRGDKKTIDSTGLFLTPWRTAKERGYGDPDRGCFQKEEYIFGVNGAVALYRREMLERIKIDSEYFDQDFHIFYEDLDIAWRAQNFGWRGYYIPAAIAYHVRGGTVRRNNGINKKYARHYLSDELYLDLVKNRYLAIIKNEKLLSLLLHVPFIIAYDICAYVYAAIFRFPLFTKVITMRIPVKESYKKRQVLEKLGNSGRCA